MIELGLHFDVGTYENRADKEGFDGSHRAKYSTAILDSERIHTGVY
jgi:hypothetical protein